MTEMCTHTHTLTGSICQVVHCFIHPQPPLPTIPWSKPPRSYPFHFRPHSVGSIKLPQPWVMWVFPWSPPVRVVSYRNNPMSRKHATCPYCQSWHSKTKLVTGLNSVSSRSRWFSTSHSSDIPWPCEGTWYQRHLHASPSHSSVSMSHSHAVRQGSQVT